MSGGSSGDGGGGSGSGSSAARYERQEQIGSGTFGHAWLVRSRASGRHYVVKEIKVTALPEQEREQSVNEVAILSQCKHVNIIRYKEAFIDQLTGSLNIVMEYADGGDLYARIVNQRATNDHFPEELILNWFIQITFAVQYLHSKNILHRDLKTQNIFLTSENLVKVGDFGIARTLRSTQELATTAIGTPYYLSPEICQRQPYNHKSDQWAVGCIVYEMCCLTHPFNASSFENLVLKILQARYSPIPSHYSLLLRDLVTVLLRTTPERRPSAEQVLMIPALKPYVDSYVQWQNAAMSPRGESHRGTVDSAQGSSNGSDDRDSSSLTSSQEDIGMSSMTTDSLETADASDTPTSADNPAATPTPTPTPAPADAQLGRRPAWRSQYANQLERQGETEGETRENRENRAPPTAVARRRSEDAGSPVSVSAAPRQRSSSLSSLSPESRRRSGREGERSHSSHTPANSAAKLKGRSQVSRGPSALIRQVLKNKFSRQESSVRPRSASDPSEPSDPVPTPAPAPAPAPPSRRERSPVSVFRRPSLSLARGGTPRSPRSPRPHSVAGRSRSPVQQGRSPVTAEAGRGSPPLVRRNARFLEAPTPRSSGPSIVRPVERRPVPRTGSTISATSNMSTDSSPAVGGEQAVRVASAARGREETGDVFGDGNPQRKEEEELYADDRTESEVTIIKQQHRQQQQPQKQQQQPEQPQQHKHRSSSVSSTSANSGQEPPSSPVQPSVEILRQKSVGSSKSGSPASGGEGKSQSRERPGELGSSDSDSQETTLVGLPVSQQPDVNHNSIRIAGGQLHARSAACAGGTCCSLICAQCRYSKDEQLARLMWASRLRTGLPTDDGPLLHQLGKILGAERLGSVLHRVQAGWDGSADGCSWWDALQLALGREQLHLLPLLVQAVQLRAAAGRQGASTGQGGSRAAGGSELRSPSGR